MDYHTMWNGFLINGNDGSHTFPGKPAGNPEKRAHIPPTAGSGGVPGDAS